MLVWCRIESGRALTGTAPTVAASAVEIVISEPNMMQIIR